MENIENEFNSLMPEDKRQALIKLVNINKLYVNYNDIDNKDLNISESEKKFTESFYKGEK